MSSMAKHIHGVQLYPLSLIPPSRLGLGSFALKPLVLLGPPVIYQVANHKSWNKEMRKHCETENGDHGDRFTSKTSRLRGNPWKLVAFHHHHHKHCSNDGLHKTQFFKNSPTYRPLHRYVPYFQLTTGRGGGGSWSLDMVNKAAVCGITALTRLHASRSCQTVSLWHSGAWQPEPMLPLSTLYHLTMHHGAGRYMIYDCETD